MRSLPQTKDRTHRLPTRNGQGQAISTEKRFASVESVEKILNCVERPPAAWSEPEGPLNELGRYYCDAIGGPVKAFLELPFGPRKWNSPGRWKHGTRIVSGRRCGSRQKGVVVGFVRRIRMTESVDFFWHFRRRSGIPDEVQTSAEWIWGRKNLVEWLSRTTAVAMQPFMRSQATDLNRRASSTDESTQRGASSRQQEREDRVWVALKNQPIEIPAVIFDNNPHLSFLLSRVSAYPFGSSSRAASCRRRRHHAYNSGKGSQAAVECQPFGSQSRDRVARRKPSR